MTWRIMCQNWLRNLTDFHKLRALFLFGSIYFVVFDLSIFIKVIHVVYLKNQVNFFQLMNRARFYCELLIVDLKSIQFFKLHCTPGFNPLHWWIKDCVALEQLHQLGHNCAKWKKWLILHNLKKKRHTSTYA